MRTKYNLFFAVSISTIIVIVFSFLFSSKLDSILHGYHSSILIATDIVDGNEVITEYRDSYGKLTYASDKKYAYVKRIRNDLGQNVQEFYFDEYGNPAEQSAGQYGAAREYNESGQNYKLTFLNEDGYPMLNTVGYATVVRTFNDKNQIVQELYCGLDGNLVQLSTGQYGTSYSYDAADHQEKATFIGENSEPIVNRFGYTSLYRTFNDDGSINTEYYLDINNNPVKINGAYGIKYIDNFRFFVNSNGTIIVSLRNVVNNFSCLIIIAAIILVVLIAILPSQFKYGILVLYVLFILSQTIVNRESGGRIELTPFWSYRQFFSSYSLRLEILNNIWLFVPFGAGIYSIFKEKLRIRWLIMISLFFSIIIEASQFFFGLGLCEVDDVISNTLGGAIGMMMAASMLEIKEWWKRKRNTTFAS